MDYYILVFGSIFALSFIYTLANLSSKKPPPGPLPWPIIGNIHLLGAKPHVSLANLAKIYGPIMSLKLGQITTVVISSSTIAKQVLKNQDQVFSTRFIPNALQAHNYHKLSVAWLPVCPQWRTLRRILNANLLSPNRLDENQHVRSKKVKELIDYCVKCSQEGEALDVGQAAFKTNLNMVSNILLSKDLVDLFSDSKVELKDVIWQVMAEVGKPNLVDFFPIFEKIDLQGIRRRTTIHFDKLFKFFDDLFNERLEEKRRGSDAKNDILEVFLNICEENSEEINHNHIKIMILVLVNVWEIGRNSTLWEDPLVFKPERFWNSNLDMRGQDFELIPFGAGRRMCPGISLASKMVLIMLGSLLNSFNWKLEADIGPAELDMEEKFGISLSKAHPLQAIPCPL
ncbi:hypothetical protein HAX54_038456 [Datura stramonium]|uniref:Cytochrome P450 n=1 Tax=Datura stramonium TaxID=4076 RepID=A0ABS8VJU6_DATST|nr:hypothetical protein [Datura stramonium]